MRKISVLFFVLVLLGTPALALGGESGSAATVEGSFLGPSRIRGTDGSVAQRTVSTGLDLPFGSLSYTGTAYEWDNASELRLGGLHRYPWDTLHALELDTGYRKDVDSRLSAFVGANLVSGFEREMSNSLTLDLAPGATWTFSPDLSLTLGGIVETTPIDHRLVPLVALAMGNATATGAWASLGFPEAGAGYRFDRRWALRASLSFDSATYRLADRGGASSAGYLRAEETVSAAFLEYSPADGLTLAPGVEYVSGRTLDVHARNGDLRRSMQPEAALGGVLRLRWEF